jgi:hypothetical protein
MRLPVLVVALFLTNGCIAPQGSTARDTIGGSATPGAIQGGRG